MWNGSEQEYNFKALRVLRHHVRTELLEECEKRGVKARYRMKCVGVKGETATGATALFENGEEVTADFIVGVDGIQSHVRGSVAKDSEPAVTGMMSIGGSVDKNTLPSSIGEVPLPCFVFAQQGGFTMMPTNPSGDKIGFFISTVQKDRSGEDWAKMSQDKQELSRMLKKHCGDDWPDLIKGIAETTAPESLSN
jgi:2-polyprenyl-6-methoxyphenol hydroxylase-like FAD-dependent oxidoreductase